MTTPACLSLGYFQPTKIICSPVKRGFTGKDPSKSVEGHLYPKPIETIHKSAQKGKRKRKFAFFFERKTFKVIKADDYRTLDWKGIKQKRGREPVP